MKEAGVAGETGLKKSERLVSRSHTLSEGPSLSSERGLLGEDLSRGGI